MCALRCKFVLSSGFVLVRPLSGAFGPARGAGWPGRGAQSSCAPAPRPFSVCARFLCALRVGAPVVAPPAALSGPRWGPSLAAPARPVGAGLAPPFGPAVGASLPSLAPAKPGHLRAWASRVAPRHRALRFPPLALGRSGAAGLPWPAGPPRPWDRPVCRAALPGGGLARACGARWGGFPAPRRERARTRTGKASWAF